MPELPEVETVKRGLEKLLVGHKILSIRSDLPKSFPNAAADVKHFLVGAKVIAVRRRAKVLIIDLDSKYSLAVHLKMTGQLVYRGKETFGAGHPSDSLVGELPDKSTRVIFSLDNDSHLYFNDQRKFGWVKLYPTIEIENIDFMKKLGPEPLSENFQFTIFNSQLQKRKKSMIKAVLLDQMVIAGVGNIYADESLWAAKIHPAQRVNEIGNARLKKLFKELISVLTLSIEKGGSTDRNYVNAEGKRGSYLSFANVYKQMGKPCPRHPETLIIKIRVAGRGTHICPKCQKLV